MTLLLSQILGIFCLAVGSSMLFRKKMLMSVLDEIFQHRALSYIVGMAELTIGLLLVLMHSMWGGFTEVAVTILGWSILLEGTAYLFLPQSVMEKILDWLHYNKVYYAIAAFYILIGVVLAYAGFK